MSKWMGWGALGLVVLVVGALIGINAPVWYEAWRASRESTRQQVYVVPAGTTARLAAGQAVTALPNEVHLTIGGQDTIVIRNDDTLPFDVGGVLVQPGQKYVQQFKHPGTFFLVCSVHTSDRIRIVVSAAE